MKMLNSVYGNEVLCCMPVFESFRRFRDGGKDPDNDPSSGQPPNAWNLETVTKVCEMLASDHSITSKLTEHQLHIKQKKRKQIHEDLGKKISVLSLFHTVSHKWDNSAVTAMHFSVISNMVDISQPSCSPDFTPADFFLFSTTKTTLKRRSFQDIEDVQTNITTE